MFMSSEICRMLPVGRAHLRLQARPLAVSSLAVAVANLEAMCRLSCLCCLSCLHATHHVHVPVQQPLLTAHAGRAVSGSTWPSAPSELFRRGLVSTAEPVLLLSCPVLPSRLCLPRTSSMPLNTF